MHKYIETDSYDLNSQLPSIIILHIWHSCTAHTVHTYISICSGKGGAIWLQLLIHLMFSQLAQVI